MEIGAAPVCDALDLSDNRLCGLKGAVKAWADRFDPGWQATAGVSRDAVDRAMQKEGRAVKRTILYERHLALGATDGALRRLGNADTVRRHRQRSISRRGTGGDFRRLPHG